MYLIEKTNGRDIKINLSLDNFRVNFYTFKTRIWREHIFIDNIIVLNLIRGSTWGKARVSGVDC
jgi:hypothetical protein